MTNPRPQSGTGEPKVSTGASHVTASRQRALFPASGPVSMGRGGPSNQVPGTTTMLPLKIDPRSCNGPIFALIGQAACPLPFSLQPSLPALPSFGELWEQTPPYASSGDSEAWLRSRSWNQPPSPDAWGNSELLPSDRVS